MDRNFLFWRLFLLALFTSADLDHLTEKYSNVEQCQTGLSSAPGTCSMAMENKYLSQAEMASINDFPDRPLQLVRPDKEHEKLVIVEENLHFLSSIKQPVTTISVVGKFHSGKSFLMNQLMSKSNGFGIGSQVTPQTMGIWIWGVPLKIKSSPDDDTHWMMLLDTEGFAANNISEKYDAKIFAVSTLMSSLLLYNSVKIIDQSDIDYLELLARRTQLFALKAQMAHEKDWIGDFSTQLLEFPPFFWIIQDFVQETNGQNCNEWLIHLLNSHTRETELYEISLKDIFPIVDCHTLFIPSAKKYFLGDLSRAKETDLTEEYRQERDQLIHKIKSTVKPKMKFDQKPFTGVELALLLRILVKGANEGSLSNIPNRWVAFLDSIQKTAVEDCFQFYCTRMENLLVDQAKNEPINSDRLERWHLESNDNSSFLLSHLLHGLDKSLEKCRLELSDLISKRYFTLSELNRQKIHVKLHFTQNLYETKVADDFLRLQLPMLSSEINEYAQNFSQALLTEFEKEVSHLVERSNLSRYINALTRTVQLNLDSTLLRNNHNLDQFFDKIITALLKDSFSQISITNAQPLPLKTFETVLKHSYERTIEVFEQKSSIFIQENIFENKYNKLKLNLIEKANVIRKDNEHAVALYIEQEMKKFLHEFKRLLSTYKESFPIDLDRLDVILKTEIEKIATAFLHDLTDYREYETFNPGQDTLRKELNELGVAVQEENFIAYKRVVEAPLKLAKKSIILFGAKYNTLFSFRQFVMSSCLLQLDEGKAKEWSSRLKMDIINSFMREDEQLRHEIESRKGLWSRIVGFFQWLIWILFG